MDFWMQLAAWALALFGGFAIGYDLRRAQERWWREEAALKASRPYPLSEDIPGPKEPPK